MIKLEDNNFKVNSKGWEENKDYKENSEKDIWEIIEGEFKGEQLFTWDAAMRETKKAGKRMPTIDEFDLLFKDTIPDFPKAGFRYYSDAALYNMGSFGNYWSSTVYGTYAYYLYFYSSGVNPAYYANRANGFSVRCVKKSKIENNSRKIENKNLAICPYCHKEIKLTKI